MRQMAGLIFFTAYTLSTIGTSYYSTLRHAVKKEEGSLENQHQEFMKLFGLSILLLVRRLLLWVEDEVIDALYEISASDSTGVIACIGGLL